MKEVNSTITMHANEVLFSAKEMYLIGLMFVRNQQKPFKDLTLFFLLMIMKLQNKCKKP